MRPAAKSSIRIGAAFGCAVTFSEKDAALRVKMWGTRGSIANPSAQTVRYGGSTVCVEVRGTDGEIVILDAGIGLHWLGQRLLGEGFAGDGEAHVLLSHLHWDHIQGLPFFTPMLLAGNRIHIYGPTAPELSLESCLLYQMQRAYCPVPNFFDDGVGAQLSIHELGEEDLTIGGMRVRARRIHQANGSISLGYRLENAGGSLAYLPDVQYTQATQFDRAVELADNVDLLIHDAYHYATDAVDDAVRVGDAADVGRVLLFHHHPDRSDDAIDAIIDSYADHRLPISAAAEGDEIRLSSA